MVNVKLLKRNRIVYQRVWLIVVYIFVLMFCIGCGQRYVTPGEGVDLAGLAGMTKEQLKEITDAEIQAILDRKPASPFPARMAYVRVQSSGYRSHMIDSYGYGNYSVVTAKDIETDEHFKKLAKLPMISAITPLNRVLIPMKLESDKELRMAASHLHADLLFVYTLDTVFRIKDHDIGPLGIMTLGFLPNQEARVRSTASAVVFDVRSGYVYGLAEATAFESQMASAWVSWEVVEDSRKKTETKAFERLLDEFTITWKGIVEQYASH